MRPQVDRKLAWYCKLLCCKNIANTFNVSYVLLLLRIFILHLAIYIFANKSIGLGLLKAKETFISEVYFGPYQTAIFFSKIVNG